MSDSSKSDVVEILSAMRNLLADPGRWTKEAFARDANGEALASNDPAACCWCLSGAHKAVRGGAGRSGIVSATLGDAIQSLGPGVACFDIAAFNDDPSTTHADILAVLDRAIAIAKAEEEPA